MATRNAASSIFNRSMQRTTFARGSQGMTGNHASTLNGTQGRQGVVTNNRGNTAGGRTFSNSSRFATGSGMDHRSSQGFSRSFSAPSRSGVLAAKAMGVAVHSDVAAAIRLVVFRVVTRPVVSPGAIRLGVSRVVVTEAAEAADKSQDKLP